MSEPRSLLERAEALLAEVKKVAEERRKEALARKLYDKAIAIAMHLGESPEARKWVYKDERFHIIYDGYGRWLAVYYNEALVYEHDFGLGGSEGWVKVYVPGSWAEELEELARRAEERMMRVKAEMACREAAELARAYGVDLGELARRYGLEDFCREVGAYA